MQAGVVLDERFTVRRPLDGKSGVDRYLGELNLLGRTVEIRVLAATGGQESLRFEREARVIATLQRLQHPAFVRFYHSGVIERTGAPYMVVEHLSGTTLKEHLAQRGPFEVAEAIRLLMPCVDALGEAHAKGIVHRNLKPSSLLVVRESSGDPMLRIRDFGLAYYGEDALGRLTETGLVYGTPAFLPPEYCRHSHVSPAGDVYQLGLVLVEMVSGVPAVEAGRPGDQARAHLEGRLRIPDMLRAPPVGDIVRKALHRRHEQRYANATELLEALDGLLTRLRRPSAPAPPPTIEADLEATLDGYRLQDELGRGAYGVVFGAKDVRTGHETAVKVLIPQPDADLRAHLRERFLQEARAASAVEHECVVAILGIGVTRLCGRPYMVMERLRGESLGDRLRSSGPMEAQVALPLFCRCLEGLGEAHRQDIVHKDLKPDNLFLTQSESGRSVMKIVDFGIARVGMLALTYTNQLACTPAYMAPEYWRKGSQPGKGVTPAFDVYQMGLVLVETLTGRTVVPGRTPEEQFRKHLAGQLDVPEWIWTSPLAAVVRHALHSDPGDRYPDGAIFGVELAAVDPARVGQAQAAARQ